MKHALRALGWRGTSHLPVNAPRQKFQMDFMDLDLEEMTLD